MSAVIETMQLSKKFGSTEAVDGLTFQVPEGSIFAYLGPNGAGKTTTIKTFMNILEPSSGSATVLGLDSRQLSPARLEQIGYVSENQELPLWMTLEYFLRYCRRFYPGWDPGLCEELLRRLELPPQRKLKHLSRGMRMKAALLSSIVYRPKLLVLDEPFSGLDPLVRDELVETILGIAADHNWTVFVSSHDLAEIENLATHVAYLDRGRIQFSEELTSLQARFRELEITCDQPPPMPSSWPSGWLRPEVSSTMLRFVASDYSEDETPQRVKALFPTCRDIAIRPLALRSIFTNLARSFR